MAWMRSIHAIRKLPDDAKQIPIPYKGTDGRVVPQGTRVIWPFACAPR